MKAMRPGPSLSPQSFFSIYLFAIFGSILLSYWIGAQQVTINSDAICYLQSAEKIGTDGLSAAMDLCGQAKWPFYSVLLFSLVKLTHFSYPFTAYALNALFSLMTVIFFLAIVRELGGSKRVLWIAALCILLAHEFNNTRQYIVRDHGFWAFYLLSLFFYLRYCRQPRFFVALAWSVSLLMAALFRIEGVVFLLLLPFSFCFISRDLFPQRLNYFFYLQFVTGIILVCALLALGMQKDRNLLNFGRVHELAYQLQHGLSLMVEHYTHAKAALAEHILTEYSRREASLVLLIVLTSWYSVSIIQNLSWIYSFLVLYAWRAKIFFTDASARGVLQSYILINILITLIFFLENFFLSKRYLVALSLTLMLWVPFALDNILEKWQRKQYRYWLPLIVVAILMTSLGGIFNFGYSKTYLREAGGWLQQHVPPEAKLYANNIQLMYYSQHFGDALFSHAANLPNMHRLTQNEWKNFDYLAIYSTKKKPAPIQAILQKKRLMPVQIFANKRGDRVLIYHISQRNKIS